MSLVQYYASQAVNISTLKAMGRSPAHYLEAVANQRKDTKALALGRVTHHAVLEPHLFDRRATVCRLTRGTRAWELFELLSGTGEVPAVYDGPVRRGKAWDSFFEAHRDQTIVLASEWGEIAPLLDAARSGGILLTEQEYEHACRIRDAVHAHPAARELLEGGVAEVPIYWSDVETGVDCKGRPDYFSHAHGLVDLKLTRNLDRRPFFSQQFQLGTHLQLPFYCDGLALTQYAYCEGIPAHIIAVENIRPHDVAVFRVPGEVVDFGREEYRKLLRRLRDCVEADLWPGTCPGIEEYEIPAWAWEGAPGDVELDFEGVDDARIECA